MACRENQSQLVDGSMGLVSVGGVSDAYTFFLEVIDRSSELTIESWWVKRWEVKGWILRGLPFGCDPALCSEIRSWYSTRFTL